MTELFAAAHTGEELMDARSFSELYWRTAPRAERQGAEPPTPLRAAAARNAVHRGGELAAKRPAPSALVSPAAAAALEAEIDRSDRRDAVERLAVHLARSYAAASALLLVHRGLIQGLCADGLAGRPDTLLFPAGAASVFGEVAASGRPFRGAPPGGGLDARILRALGREHVQEMAILPVALCGRTVNLLYADNGPEALGDASVAALHSICARVAGAYERLIRERKRSGRG